MKRSGVADLPLHSGKAPRWLFSRMVKLAGGISEVILEEYGTEELLRRLSDPYWFQGFACVLGFDWHSSGTTTTTCGALKQALGPEEHGLAVAGGKGRASRKAPEEIQRMGEVLSLSSRKVEKLEHASRLSAKVDNSCVQDGYQLYHHTFIFTERGSWAVVQQGMGDRLARRYHWLSDDVQSFVEEPHSAICCDRREEGALDMTSKESREARKVSLDIARESPERFRGYFRPRGQRQLADFTGGEVDAISLPGHHPVLDADIGEKGFEVLRKAYEFQPESYDELVLLRGMGPKKVRALALISDLVYGAKPSWRDPVKYSFAHGGKDGFPYPVDREVYDSSISMLREAVEGAKVGDRERSRAIKRLKDFTI